MLIELETIVDALEKASPDTRAYVSLKTGKVETCQEDEFGEYTDGVCIPASNPDYLLLPGQLEIDEYHMMRSFALGTADAKKRETMLKALLEPGAYTSFHRAVKETGMEPAWKRYKKKRCFSIAADFCAKNGLEFTERQRILKADPRNRDMLVRLRLSQLKNRDLPVSDVLQAEIRSFFEKHLGTRSFHAFIGMEGKIPRSCACLLIHDYIPSTYHPNGKAGYISCIYLEDEKYTSQLKEIIEKLEKTALYFHCSTLYLEKNSAIAPLIEKLGYIQDEDWMVKKVCSPH